MSENVNQLLQRALEVTGAIARPTSKAGAFIQIAEIYQETGQNARAEALLSDVLRLADSIKRPDEKAAVLAGLGRLFYSAGGEKDSRQIFDRALLLARALETPAQKAEALYTIASELADSGLKARAAGTLIELKKIVDVPENNLDAVAELTGIAEIYTDIEMLSQSQAILEEALRITLSLKDNWFRSQRMLEIAREQIQAGQAKAAVSILEDLPKTASLIEESHRIYFLISMAGLFLELKDSQKAGVLLADATYLTRNHAPDEIKIRDLVEIAVRYAQAGDRKTSIELLHEAEGIAGSLANPAEKISDLIGIAGQLAQMGEPAEAAVLAQKAAELCAGLDPKTAIYLLGSLALLYLKLLQRQKALEAVSQIVALVQEQKIKTSGLGALVADLCQVGEFEPALSLAGIIREPEIKAGALIEVARFLGKQSP